MGRAASFRVASRTWNSVVAEVHVVQAKAALNALTFQSLQGGVGWSVHEETVVGIGNDICPSRAFQELCKLGKPLDPKDCKKSLLNGSLGKGTNSE